MKILFQIFLRR